MIRGERFGLVREWGCAAFLSVFALGAGLVSGRDIAFFYAQTGDASWLGIALSSALYGLFVSVTAQFARRTGAASFPQIFRRSMGVYAGGAVWTLHLLALAAYAWIALTEAGRAAGLLLPFRGAELAGVVLAFLTAIAICIAPTRSGLCFFGLVAVMLALLFGGEMPSEAQLYLHTRLKLEDSWRGAMLLGLLHGSRCMAVTASAACAFGRRLRPAALGLACAVCTAILLGLANGVLRSYPAELMALRQPFAALMGQRGKTGYFCAALMLWGCGAISIAGILLSFRAVLGREC